MPENAFVVRTFPNNVEAEFAQSVLDAEMDFSPYKALMVPDEGRVDAALKAKLATRFDSC